MTVMVDNEYLDRKVKKLTDLYLKMIMESKDNKEIAYTNAMVFAYLLRVHYSMAENDLGAFKESLSQLLKPYNLEVSDIKQIITFGSSAVQ